MTYAKRMTESWKKKKKRGQSSSLNHLSVAKLWNPHNVQDDPCGSKKDQIHKVLVTCLIEHYSSRGKIGKTYKKGTT